MTDTGEREQRRRGLTAWKDSGRVLSRSSARTAPGERPTAPPGLARELPRLPECAAPAKAAAEGFRAAGAPWFRGRPRPPHTHRFQVWPLCPAKALTKAAVRQAEETG
ncbi:hypothetical protein [Streptomyces sp. Wb2n-11]|uniref:hypothetical protein n=1 Tax=Streptomyces sp. Wb2n-11 TaxID=1030533 RepID=UPI000B159F74